MNKAEKIYNAFNEAEKDWIDSGANDYAGSIGIKENAFSPEFPLQGHIVEWCNIGMFGLKQIQYYN